MESPSLVAGLLRAHAALCCQEESLACMLGGASGGGEGLRGALAARYHLASCLRCYLEAVEAWQVGRGSGRRQGQRRLLRARAESRWLGGG